eukprot:scaffold7051_cov79-Cylindrotheca_fusiformis.AAC.1
MQSLLIYRMLVSCLLLMERINLVNAYSNVATTSPSPSDTPTNSSSTSFSSSSSPNNSIIRNETTTLIDCSNTLHLVHHGDLSSCEDDSVSCSSDPIIAANCCKCKPRCCNQCSTPSSNPEDLDICNSTTEIDDHNGKKEEDDEDERNSKLPGMIAYCVGMVALVCCAINQRSTVLSREQQQKRRKDMPTKFYIATIPSSVDGGGADAHAKDEIAKHVQSLLEEQKGTSLKKIADGDIEDQATETRDEMSLDDTSHEGDDNINMALSNIVVATCGGCAAGGDIEDQAGEVMYDIPLGNNNSSNPDDDDDDENDDERIRTEASSEITECSIYEAKEHGQLALQDGHDDNNDVIVNGDGETSLSERTNTISSTTSTTTAAAECPICLEPYRPGDTICVSKFSPHCNHIFHQECITAWISEHNLCPLCRVDLMTSKKNHDTSKAKGNKQ